VIGPYEVFSSAGSLWHTLRGEDGAASFEVVTASVDGGPVQFAGGVTVQPELAVTQVKKTDLVYVPTIGLGLDAALAHNHAMLGLLKRQGRRGTLIAGVCTGVALLAEAGLLDGRPATTHWALADEYRRRYPQVDWQPERFITESDNLFCGGGVYAALDLCLYLVERLAGYEVARQTGRALLIDPPRTWQASFSAPRLRQQHHDDKVRQAQDYLHAHFDRPLTVAALASQLGMSPRNLARRFRQATGDSVLNYLHKLRIDRAKQLLEAEFKPVQQVCYAVGYEDVPFFRNVFRRHTGLSPTDYRRRFAGSAPLQQGPG
jgi:transcriptional regulator GlxA family with amidase domain